MSQWGVFRELCDLHIVPCSPEGLVIDHALTSDCDCEPKPEPRAEGTIWVHQDRERGGYNS